MEIMKIPNEKVLRNQCDCIFKNRATAILASINDNQRDLVQELVDKGFNLIELAAVFAHLAREKEAPIR